MTESLTIRDGGQTEVFFRALKCELPTDARVPRIGQSSKLATLARQRGDLRIALTHEKAALSNCLALQTVADTTALQALTAAKFYNIGQMHYQLKEFDAAKISFEQACQLDARSGNLVGQAADSRGLAFVKQDTGDLRGALELHKHALEFDTGASFLYGIAIDQANLGVNYMNLAEAVPAKNCLLEALRAFEALGRTHEATQVRMLLETAIG